MNGLFGMDWRSYFPKLRINVKSDGFYDFFFFVLLLTLAAPPISAHERVNLHSLSLLQGPESNQFTKYFFSSFFFSPGKDDYTYNTNSGRGRCG